MTYTNTPAVVSQQTTSYSSGNIPYTSIALLENIPHSAQLEVERIFVVDRDGSAATLLAFLADTAVTTAQKKAVFIIPISRCTLNTATKNISAINLPASGDVYNYVITTPTPTTYTIKVPILSSSTVTVRRKTVSNEPLVNWVAGSRLTSKQLNLATTQSLYLLQEAIEKIGTSLTLSATQITVVSLADAAVTPTKISSTTDPWSFYGTIQTVAPTANLHATTRLYALDKFFQHGVMTKDDVAPTSSAVDILETAATAGNSGLWFNPKNGTINLWAGNAWVTVAGTPVTTANLVSTNTVQTLTAAKTFAAGTVVPFTQTGTGAVARTVDAKLKDTVSVKDFGAVGDGVTDDTAAINLAINTNKGIYFPPGTYIVSSKLYPKSNTCWNSDKNATLKWTTNVCLIDAQSINNWEINGIIVDGNFTAYVVSAGQNPWAIRLESSTNILITNCVFKNLYRIGICVGHESATQCSNVTISNNVINNCGSLTDTSPGFGSGIAIISALGVSIINNYIYDINGSGGSATAGIDLEPDPAWNCGDIEIAFNKIENVLNASGIQLYPGATPFSGNWNNINIHDNTISNTGTAPGIKCIEFGHTYINDNYLNLTKGILIQRYRSSEVSIEGNDIRQVTSSGYGIRITDGAAAAVIRGNSIRNVAGIGIECSMYDLVTGMNAKGCIITDNDLHDINSHGISILAGNFVISNNVLVGCCLTNATGFFINSIAGGVYASINGFIGNNVLFQNGAYSFTAFIRAEGDVFNNVVFGNNTFVGTALTYLTTSIAGRCPGVFMDVLPAAGTWKVGDIINTLTPASAGFIGWVCTAAGTPGTFRTFGLIS